MFSSGRIQAWLTRVAAFVYLLANVSPAGNGLVLCIGQDGHVAIAVTDLDADCSDCLPAEPAAESCCTPAASQAQVPASCTCSHIPMLAGVLEVDSTAPPQQGTAVPPPACVLVAADFLFPPPLPRGPVLRGRAQLPPCPRVPSLLTLRI